MRLFKPVILTEAQKAWLACAIDGEGCIYIRRHHETSSKPYPTVTIYNTDLNFVEHAKSLTDGLINTMPISEHQYGKKKSHYKKCYKLKISGNRCYPVLSQVMPYLIIKKDKAIEALSLCNISREEHIKKLNEAILSKRMRDKKGRWLPMEKIVQ